MEYCTVEKKYKSVEETSKQNYFNYLKLKKSGLSSDSHVDCSKVITVRRTRRNLYTAIVENFGEKMVKVAGRKLKTSRKPARKKIVPINPEKLGEKSGFEMMKNSINRLLSYKFHDEKEFKRLKSDIALDQSILPNSEAMKKVKSNYNFIDKETDILPYKLIEIPFNDERSVPPKKRKGLKWCIPNRDNTEASNVVLESECNHCLDSPKPLVIDETESASERNKLLVENIIQKEDTGNCVFREHQNSENIKDRPVNDIKFENIDQTSDKPKYETITIISNPLDQKKDEKCKKFDERLFFDDVHKILTIHTMQVANRLNDVTEEEPLYFKENDVGNEIIIENIVEDPTDHIICSESSSENANVVLSENLPCSENDEASNLAYKVPSNENGQVSHSINEVPPELLSCIMNDHSLYSKAVDSRIISSSEPDRVKLNESPIKHESHSLHFVDDDPSELCSCSSMSSNEIPSELAASMDDVPSERKLPSLAAFNKVPLEFELLSPHRINDISSGLISYTPNFGEVISELAACLKGIEEGKPVADEREVISSSSENEECNEIFKRTGIGNRKEQLHKGISDKVQEDFQIECSQELYTSSHTDEKVENSENSHSSDVLENGKSNEACETQNELEQSVEMSKNGQNEKDDEDEISQIPSKEERVSENSITNHTLRKRSHSKDETIVIPMKKNKLTANSDEDMDILNEIVEKNKTIIQNETAKENDQIVKSTDESKNNETVGKLSKKHNYHPNKGNNNSTRNSLRIRKECQMFNFSGRNLLNPSKVLNTHLNVVEDSLMDLLTNPIPKLDETSDVPNVIRIEKSPSKVMNNSEPLKNGILGKFSTMRNLSKFVQKEEESKEESAWDNDVKTDVKEEPKLTEIEVVHYKKDRIPNDFNPLPIPKRKYCPFCNVGYTNEVVLGRHLTQCKMHPKNLKDDPTKVFLCKYCNLGITDEVYFKQHEEKCQKQFLYKQNSRIYPTLDESVVNSFVKEKRRYSCPNCDYTSKNVGHMKVHRRIHSKVFLCVCDICQKGFNRLDALQIHMFRHINVAEKVEELEKVKVQNDNAYKSTLSLIINKKRYKVYKFACVKCSYVTPVGESMDKHFKTMHLSTPKLQCNICGFSTKLKSNLKQHLNRHLRVKTHKCSFCPYETVSTTYIRKHENQVHLKKVVTKCEFCDFSTYHKDNLKIHMNSAHIKSVKYSCDKCSYESYMNSNLINHVKSVHDGMKRKKKPKKLC